MSEQQRLKIVHVINDLESGGAQRMLTKLVCNMDMCRFENVIVALRSGGVFGPVVRSAGVVVHSLNWISAGSTANVLVRLTRILRQERPNVIQTWLYHADLLGLLCGFASGHKTVAWNVRCSDMQLSRYSVGLRCILNGLAFLSSWPAAVLFNSEAGKQHHLRLGYRPRRSLVIPNGFDEVLFQRDPAARSSLRRELNLPEGTQLIGMIARYDPMKDHATFLAAAKLAARDASGPYFIMAGRGISWDNRDLVTQVKAMGVEDQVRLLGERPDVLKIMAALDLLALPSAFGEGFPNVIGEAMACGVPCVVSAVGDARLVVGDCGIVVPPGDAAALSGAWKEILSLDAAARISLGEAARLRIADRFSISKIVGQYASLYASLNASQQ